MPDARAKAAALSCWSGPVEPEPLTGGITNTNFKVVDSEHAYVVRVGTDIPVHHVMRFNELAASRAAFLAGVSPEVVHSEPGILVIRFVDGHTLTPEDVRQRPMLERIVPLLLRAHRETLKHLRGAALFFSPFHEVREYAHTLRADHSRFVARLPEFLAVVERLEQAVGAFDIVYGHNDLLAANLIDDGQRLWLIDWDYAGFASALFDLGGLSSNNALSVDDESWLLETYFERPVDDELRHRYQAMKCASLLREAVWSMVSEHHSTIDFDYVAYTEENLARYQTALDVFSRS